MRPKVVARFLQFLIWQWERKRRKRVFVPVDSFEMYQARLVLVGWVVGIGADPAVPSVPAQNKGRFRKHESMSTESRHACKHTRKHARKHARKVRNTKARTKACTKARTKARTKAQKAKKAEKHRKYRKHKKHRARKHKHTESTESTEARKHRKHRARTHRESAKKAGYPEGALWVWVLLAAIGWLYGREISVGSYAG